MMKKINMLSGEDVDHKDALVVDLVKFPELQ